MDFEHKNVKPCPFCGNKIVITRLIGIYKWWGAAMCSSCFASSSHVRAGNEEWRNDAIDEWNKRK